MIRLQHGRRKALLAVIPIVVLASAIVVASVSNAADGGAPGDTAN